MPNFSELQYEFNTLPPSNRVTWVNEKCSQYLGDISKILGDTNVLCYFSAFLNKPQLPNISLSREDINGFMHAFSGIDPDKNLALILHTPGGDLMAVEMIIEYIHSKFKHVTAIIPVISASAGSMIALSCDKIIVSRAGQLGPTDPQMALQGTYYSVKELISQFQMARNDIGQNPIMAHFWAPILSYFSPSLYQKALNMNEHSIEKLEQWLSRKSYDVFTRTQIINSFHKDPKVHYKRIDYKDMKKLGLQVSLLEDDQALQDAVLSVYHIMTLKVYTSQAAKLIYTDKMRGWYQP